MTRRCNQQLFISGVQVTPIMQTVHSKVGNTTVVKDIKSSPSNSMEFWRLVTETGSKSDLQTPMVFIIYMHWPICMCNWTYLFICLFVFSTTQKTGSCSVFCFLLTSKHACHLTCPSNRLLIWVARGLTFCNIIVYGSFDLGKAPLHIAVPTAGPCTKHELLLQIPPINSTSHALALSYTSYDHKRDKRAIQNRKLIVHFGCARYIILYIYIGSTLIFSLNNYHTVIATWTSILHVYPSMLAMLHR